MILIPLRTDSPIRRTPMANYALIAANILVFLVTYDFTPPRRSPLSSALAVPSGPLREAFGPYRLMLEGADPQLHQLFSYQFLHDGWQHLLGNMLFLWVFGNSVNAKMGQIAYVLFYLSCGVLAGATYLTISDSPMLGASGAIAGVTMAFLVLFPKSRTSFFYWFFVIGYFELPSMILIVVKVIIYDNMIEPLLSGATGVAYSAHISGYIAGLGIAVLLLLVRAVPRDQFDLLALWKRAYQRRAFAHAVANDPMADVRAQYGRMARTDSSSRSGLGKAPDVGVLDRVADVRREITEAMRANDLAAASRGYLDMVALDPGLVLPRHHQLDVANALANQQQYAQAVEAYEKYLAHYPTADHCEEARLMLGIIYAKHLKQYDRAEAHLLACRDALTDAAQIELCSAWLGTVAKALGRPTPGTE